MVFIDYNMTREVLFYLYYFEFEFLVNDVFVANGEVISISKVFRSRIKIASLQFTTSINKNTY